MVPRSTAYISRFQILEFTDSSPIGDAASLPTL
jgi:hypothetical protein